MDPYICLFAVFIFVPELKRLFGILIIHLFSALVQSLLCIGYPSAEMIKDKERILTWVFVDVVT